MRKDHFPKQDTPLYQFSIDPMNRLSRTEHRRYDAISHENNGRITYRICTRNGIKTKKDVQLDKVLSDSLWTFDPDFQAALKKFEKRSESDLIHAETMLESAKEFSRSIALVACTNAFCDTGNEWPD